MKGKDAVETFRQWVGVWKENEGMVRETEWINRKKESDEKMQDHGNAQGLL